MNRHPRLPCDLCGRRRPVAGFGMCGTCYAYTRRLAGIREPSREYRRGGPARPPITRTWTWVEEVAATVAGLTPRLVGTPRPVTVPVLCPGCGHPLRAHAAWRGRRCWWGAEWGDRDARCPCGTE